MSLTMGDVRDLHPYHYSVVDLDTGTILGTNVVLVNIDNLSPEDFDVIDRGESDSEVWDVAKRNGEPLWVDLTNR